MKKDQWDRQRQSQFIMKKKKKKLINSKEVEISRQNQISDGLLPTLFKTCFCCSFFKTNKGKENSELFNQAKNIIKNYSDIISIIKSLFEYK